MKCPNCYNEIRDGAKFCSFCGHKLTTAKPTEIVRPQRGGQAPPPPPAAPPVYTPPPAQQPYQAAPPYQPPYAPQPAPAPPPAARRRGLPLILAGAAVLLLGLAAVWFFFLRDGGGSGAAPAGDRVLISIQPSSDSFLFGETLTAISRNGEDEQEVAFDRDGLWAGFAYDNAHEGVAGNGRWLVANRTQDEGVEMMLVPADGGAELYSDADASLNGAFAPDSSVYAYNRLTTNDDGEEEITLVVVDAEGVVVGEWPDLVFSDFFGGSDRLLVARTDDEGLLSDLATLQLPDGQPVNVVSLSDSTAEVAPFVFDNLIYYRDDDQLLRVEADGEGKETIYRFESDAPLVFVPPGSDLLLVLEREESANYGDLYAVAPDGSDRVRLGEEVYLDPADNGSVGPAVVVAGDRLAYTTYASDGLSLYVINNDGSDRRRLADEQAWLLFAFAPDGDSLAYVAGAEAYQPGDLFVAELPEGDATRLARDAWSFMYSGGRILYSTVEDAASDNPESVIHSITPAGEEDETIYGPVDGLIRFVSPVQ